MVLVFFIVILSHLAEISQGELRVGFYNSRCPTAETIVSNVVRQVAASNQNIAPVLLRLHFHDCFVQGCDASILLDPTDTIDSEKGAFGNNNSARGFDVVDQMKAALETACPGIVSCADILTIAAEQSVALSGGPSWTNLLGRRDSTTANRTLADENLPGPTLTLEELKAKFINVGLNGDTDLVSLSGAHTFGRSQCQFFSQRLYNFNGTNQPDPSLDTTYLQVLQALCPEGGNGSVLANLDTSTPDVFDNNYFTNLQGKKGLLQTDQELFSTAGADTIDIVNLYGSNQTAFFERFVVSMIRMGNLSVLTGSEGEVRLNCSKVNGISSLSSGDDLISSF